MNISEAIIELTNMYVDSSKKFMFVQEDGIIYRVQINTAVYKSDLTKDDFQDQFKLDTAYYIIDEQEENCLPN